MPKHFRDAIYEEAHAKTANLLVMVPWFDECVRVFPLATWSDRIAQMEQQLLGFDTLGYSHEESDLRRLIFGTAITVQMDGHGRIVLPADLRESASIERDVFWVGLGSCLELWAPEKLRAQLGVDRVRALRARLVAIGRRAPALPRPGDSTPEAPEVSV